MNYDKPFVSAEQEKRYDVLQGVSNKITEKIEEERKIALSVLIDEKNSASAKIKELEGFFDRRMSQSDRIVEYENKSYSLNDLQVLAREILDDESFAYNDANLVLDNLNPFLSSIEVSDIILAYHYYRLTEDDKALAILSMLLGYYIKMVFEMDTDVIDYDICLNATSHNDSIRLINSVLLFIDEYLEKYASMRKEYEGKYKCISIEKLEKESFSSLIDIRAAQDLGQTNPREIRKKKVLEYLSRIEDYDYTLEFKIGCILEEYYEHCENPTYNGLITYMNEINYRCRINGGYDKTVCERIYAFIVGLKNKRKVEEIDDIIRIMPEDEDEANVNNCTVNKDIVFEYKIAKYISVFYLTNIIVDIIPEFADEDNKKKNTKRKTMCRRLYSIFEDDSFYEDIQNTEIINGSLMHEREERIKLLFYESLFRDLVDSDSVENLLEKRIELLDRARAISIDVNFIERCAKRITDLIQVLLSQENYAEEKKSVERLVCREGESLLDDSIINTLATAEMLFNKYANDKYANEGFDYSCISALYYQAFENAYNDLIWEKYVRFLMNLTLDGRSFIRIMQDNYTKTITDKREGFGFLPCAAKNRKYYTKNENGKFGIVDSCMYKSFYKLIGGKDYPVEEIPEFYDWLSKEFGFKNRIEMLNCHEFVKILSRFRNSLGNAVDPRNKSSHGGTKIDIEQCRHDKLLILTEIEEIRDNQLGLIQLLLDLLSFNTKCCD